MYIFLVFASALVLGVYEVLKKVSLKKSDIYEVLFFYCMSGFLLSIVFSRNMFSVSLLDILFVLLKSGIIVVNWLLVMKALKKLDVGVVVPFSLLNTILVVFGSHFIYKEDITWIHFVSLLIISIGIIFITRLNNKNESKKEKGYFQAFAFLLGSCVLGSASGLLDKYLVNIRGIESSLVLSWFLLFNTIIYGIIYLCKNKKINFKVIIDNYWVVFTGISIALADILYYTAISIEDAQLSIISIVRKMSVVVSTVLASIFLKEKKLVKKILILGFMLIGVALPAFFN